MERYAKELDLPHLASMVRGVLDLVEDYKDLTHKAPQPAAGSTLSDLLNELEDVATRLEDATDLVVYDIVYGRGGNKRNVYTLEYLRYFKPKPCHEAQLTTAVTYPRPAAGMADEDADRCALLLAVAAARALALGCRTPDAVANGQRSGHYSQKVALDATALLWLAPSEVKALDALTGTLRLVLDERFERRAQVVGASKKSTVPTQNKPKNGKAVTSDVMDVETGAEDMSDTQQANPAKAAAEALMKQVTEAHKTGDYRLMLELAQQGVVQFPQAMIRVHGAMVNAFAQAASGAMRLQNQYVGSNPKEIVAAVVEAAPKAQVAPGVTVVDVTAGAKAAAAKAAPRTGATTRKPRSTAAKATGGKSAAVKSAPPAVEVTAADHNVPGVRAEIVALARTGHFEGDTPPFTDAGEAAAEVIIYTQMEPGLLVKRSADGDAKATAELIRRLTTNGTTAVEPEPDPEPIDPFAGLSIDELLVKVAEQVPGALEAARERLDAPLSADGPEQVRPVTAPPAMLVPVPVAPVTVPTAMDPADIRDEETQLEVWVLTANVSKDARRGLNQALMRRVVWQSGEKGNRPSTTVTTHKTDRKFRVVVTVPAGVDRTKVANLLAMVAADTSLGLHGLTTPAETVNA